MSKIDLDELGLLAAQATPGPWKEGRHDMFSIVEGAHAKYIYANSIPVAISTGEEKDCERVLADARYIAAACNAVPSLIARVREQELINSHLRNQVEGLEELTDDLRANEHELTKQLDFVANCLAQSEKCFMPKEFSCSYRTPYGLYCHAEKAIRMNCIYCRAEEAAKQAGMEVEDAD